jgi:hypothetical protein
MNLLSMVEWQALKSLKRLGVICVASALTLVYSFLEPNLAFGEMGSLWIGIMSFLLYQQRFNFPMLLFLSFSFQTLWLLYSLFLSYGPKPTSPFV